VDKWLAQAEHELSKPKRIALMKEVLKAYTEEVPALALYYKSNTSVVPNALQGYHLSPHVYTEFLEIEKWQWKP
jgi:peptide/nickel transport system substrate-binding protein